MDERSETKSYHFHSQSETEPVAKWRFRNYNEQLEAYHGVQPAKKKDRVHSDKKKE